MIAQVRKILRAGTRFMAEHRRSVWESASVDRDGHPVPWFTYPAIAHLGQHDWTSASVLEWGSGNSTLWWAERAQHVTAVEHNAEWFGNIAERTPSNAIVKLEVDQHRYVNTAGDGPFQVVVVDGVWRDQCVERALQVVSPEGLIVLDNSDRYPGLCQILRESDRYQVDFRGFGPIVDFQTCTSLFIGPQVSIPSRPGRPLPRANY